MTSMLSISQPITCRGNAKGTDGNSTQFAIVTITLSPMPSGDSNKISIAHSNVVLVQQTGETYGGHNARYFVEGAIQGVQDVIAHYKSLGLTVSGLIATIENLVVHDIDSTERPFRIAARNAIASCFVNSQ